jgi:ABC-type sugar transport system ATPase subunit
MRGVGIRFGHIRALEKVDLTVAAGEVLALVGDNGAGKSTVVRVLAGVIRPDAGELFLHGRRVELRSPADARRRGIAAVFQDLAVVECLDVATNLFIGGLPGRGPFVDRRLMERETRAVIERMELAGCSPDTPVGLLPAGHRQAIAISRAVRSQASVVVMDEPTASLGYSERGRVELLIDSLRERGAAVILISHDLQVVFDHADRIQVLRLGRTVGVRDRRVTDRDEIVGMITGART